MAGNWGGIAGGIIGGLVGGAIGVGAASGIYNILGKSAFSFAGGFLGGAVEFGLSGFGAGFGYSLGSGAGFGDALQAGLVSGAISGVIGGFVQGSYNAGWQNFAHGQDRTAVGKAAGVEREISLEVVRKPLVYQRAAKEIIGESEVDYHWGLRIEDNYNEFSGTWDFDYRHTGANDAAVLIFGEKTTGYAGLATNKSWTISDPKSADLKYITKVYGNIQQNLGKHSYKLDSYTCQTWVQNRLALRNDNFR